MKTHTWKTSYISKGPARLKMLKALWDKSSLRVPLYKSKMPLLVLYLLHGHSWTTSSGPLCTGGSDACLMVVGQKFAILITQAKLTC